MEEKYNNCWYGVRGFSGPKTEEVEAVREAIEHRLLAGFKFPAYQIAKEAIAAYERSKRGIPYK